MIKFIVRRAPAQLEDPRSPARNVNKSFQGPSVRLDSREKPADANQNISINQAVLRAAQNRIEVLASKQKQAIVIHPRCGKNNSLRRRLSSSEVGGTRF